MPTIILYEVGGSCSNPIGSGLRILTDTFYDGGGTGVLI